MSKATVNKYRRAAIKLYGISKEQAEKTILSPKDDTGQWAPQALAIIYLEEGNACTAALDSYREGGKGLDACVTLGEEAGVGFIEYINAAVAAVYD